MTDLPRTDDDTAILDAFRHVEPRPDEDEQDGRDEDLAAALASAAPRRWWNRGTLVLGGCALLLAGFLSGVLVEQHFGTTNRSSAARGAGNFAGFSGAGRGSGAQGGSGTAAAATTGTVKLVDGTTIYLQTPNGDVITIRTNAKTSVRRPPRARSATSRPGRPSPSRARRPRTARSRRPR